MTIDVIDKKGFRKNVCIVMTNNLDKVFFARRSTDKGWQFPQGGVLLGETYRQAMYRELFEEVGLTEKDVTIIGITDRLYFYKLPKAYVNHHKKPLCIGQKQKWYLLKLKSSEQEINLNVAAQPEFDSFKWINYWDTINEVVDFKKEVYRSALRHLERIRAH